MKRVLTLFTLVALLLSSLFLYSCSGAKAPGTAVENVNGITPEEALSAAILTIEASDRISADESRAQTIKAFAFLTESSETKTLEIFSDGVFYQAFSKSDDNFAKVTHTWTVGTWNAETQLFSVDKTSQVNEGEAYREITESYSSSPHSFKNQYVLGSIEISEIESAIDNGEAWKAYKTDDGRYAVQLVRDKDSEYFHYNDSSSEVLTVYFDSELRIGEVVLETKSSGSTSDTIRMSMTFRYGDDVPAIPEIPNVEPVIY